MNKILFVFLILSINAIGQRTKTLSDWKLDYDTRYSYVGNYEEKGWRDAYNLSRDNGDIYPMAYVLYGDYLMWRATGEDTYIQRYISFYQGLFDRALLSSSVGLNGNTPDGFQYFTGDSYYSWYDYPQTTDVRSPDGMPQNFTGGDLGVSHFQIPNPTGYEQFSLDEGFGLRGVSDALLTMYKSPVWRSEGTNQSKYESLLNFMLTNVWDKWDSRYGNHFFRERTHMASHWANMGMNFYLITGEQKYLTVLDRFMTNMSAWNSEAINLTFPSYGMSNGQLRVDVDGGYVWDGVWGGEGVNDVNHANSEVATIIRSIELGFTYFSVSDLDKFKLAYDRIKLNDTYGSYNVDGSGAETWLINTFDVNGWLLLAPYYEDIVEGLEVASVNGSVYRLRRYASGAFGSAALDGSLFYPEIDTGLEPSTSTKNQKLIYWRY